MHTNICFRKRVFLPIHHSEWNLSFETWHKKITRTINKYIYIYICIFPKGNLSPNTWFRMNDVTVIWNTTQKITRTINNEPPTARLLQAGNIQQVNMTILKIVLFQSCWNNKKSSQFTLHTTDTSTQNNDAQNHSTPQTTNTMGWLRLVGSLKI